MYINKLIEETINNRWELMYKLSEQDVIPITIDDVILINKYLTNISTELHKVDISLLSSAINAIYNYIQYEDIKDIEILSTILLEKLIKDHAFFNGNKRTAVIAMEIFLKLNNKELPASNDKLLKLVYNIAKNEKTYHDVYIDIFKTKFITRNLEFITPY
jgi:death-on-curing protein